MQNKKEIQLISILTSSKGKASYNRSSLCGNEEEGEEEIMEEEEEENA